MSLGVRGQAGVSRHLFFVSSRISKPHIFDNKNNNIAILCRIVNNITIPNNNNKNINNNRLFTNNNEINNYLCPILNIITIDVVIIIIISIIFNINNVDNDLVFTNILRLAFSNDSKQCYCRTTQYR